MRSKSKPHKPTKKKVKAAAKKGKGQRGGHSIGSTDPTVLNAAEMSFCEAFVRDGSIRSAMIACGMSPTSCSTAQVWMKKPKIAIYIAELQTKARELRLQMSAEQIANEHLLIRSLTRERVIEILQSPRDSFSGYRDIIGAGNLGHRITSEGKAVPTVLPPGGLNVVGDNNQILVDQKTAQLLGSQVYRSPWVRELNGINDPLSESVDAEFLVVRKQREDAALSRGRGLAENAVASEDGGTMGSTPKQS